MKIDALLEVFNEVYPFKLVADEEKSIDYSFVTDGGDTVDVYIDIAWDNNAVVWDVSFSRNGTDRVTDGGDAFKIFATVLQVIRDFIKRRNPARLRFASSKYKGVEQSESREKLYNRMVNRFASAAGYTVNITDKPMLRMYTLIQKHKKV